MFACHCVQLSYTTQHRTVLIIFPPNQPPGRQSSQLRCCLLEWEWLRYELYATAYEQWTHADVNASQTNHGYIQFSYSESWTASGPERYGFAHRLRSTYRQEMGPRLARDVRRWRRKLSWQTSSTPSLTMLCLWPLSHDDRKSGNIGLQGGRKTADPSCLLI